MGVGWWGGVLASLEGKGLSISWFAYRKKYPCSIVYTARQLWLAMVSNNAGNQVIKLLRIHP